MIAGFTGMLWLVPFNVIQLSVSLPVRRQAGPAAPAGAVRHLAADAGRRRARRPAGAHHAIHVGIFALFVVAGLSVAFNAPDLNQTMEFDLAFKKLTLLASYVLAFLIVASSVRPARSQRSSSST